MQRIWVMLSCCAELRKDFVKRAPLPGAEAAAPVRSLAPPPTNMAQANNARGEGKVLNTAWLHLHKEAAIMACSGTDCCCL